MDVSRRVDLVAIGMIAVTTAVGVYFWTDLPAQLAIHWGASGSPDTVVSKPLALLGIFLFGAATVGFTRIAPPSLTNTPGGPDVAILFVGLVFAWVQGTIIVWNLGYRFDIGLAVVPILVLAGALVAYAYRLE